MRTLLSAMEGLARRVGIARSCGLLLIAAFVILRIWEPVPLQVLQLKTFDLYQMVRPAQPQSRPVVIVDIDEKSLAAQGQWPWSRDVLADLVTRITEMGATAIGFDIIMPEPDRMSPAKVADHLRGLDDEVRQRLRALPGNDRLLAEAIAEGTVIVAQSGYSGGGTEATAADPSPASIVTLGGDPRPFLISLPKLVANLPELEAAAAGSGLVTIRPEMDGVVRRVPAIMAVAGEVKPALAIELLRVAVGEQSLMVRSDAAGVRNLVLGTTSLRTDRNGQLWVNFSGHDPRRYVSATDVLDGTLPDEVLADKLVLIGTSAVGLFDMKSTPLDASIPGVEIHAQLVENILSNTLLYRPNFALGLELALAVVMSLVMVVLVPMLGARLVFALGFFIACVLMAGSLLLFDRRLVLVDPVFPLMSSFSVYLLLVFVNYVREEKQRSMIRSAFGQYISRDLVEQLTQDPDRLVLGGETRELTLLFCDVRKFTTISELYKDDPQGLTALMNRFLTPLSTAITNQKGTIDKYMGDAIMAFWNAPVDLADHAGHACDAALEMLKRLESLNVDLEHEAEAAGRAFIALRVGIGLNTGTCLVGNLGSDLRFDYSALGDPVNLASRIEGLTKRYGVAILVGEHTRVLASRHAFVEADLIQVVGKTVPERIYALVGDQELRDSPAFGEFVACHERALAAYRAARWDEAEEALAEAEERLPAGLDLTGLYKLYRDRIAEYSAAAPMPGWSGVEVATEK